MGFFLHRNGPICLSNDAHQAHVSHSFRFFVLPLGLCSITCQTRSWFHYTVRCMENFLPAKLLSATWPELNQPRVFTIECPFGYTSCRMKWQILLLAIPGQMQIKREKTCGFSTCLFFSSFLIPSKLRPLILFSFFQLEVTPWASSREERVSAAICLCGQGCHLFDAFFPCVPVNEVRQNNKRADIYQPCLQLTGPSSPHTKMISRLGMRSAFSLQGWENLTL